MTITITVEKDGYYEVNGMRHEPTVSLYVIPAASKLRRMLKDTQDLIICPGVYDGLSARVAMEVGFKALYMVGFSELRNATLTRTLTVETDRGGYNRLQARNGGSGVGSTSRYADQRRNDC